VVIPLISNNPKNSLLVLFCQGERNEINVVIETPKGLLVAGNLKG
jgi:hypothetical protein